MTAPQDVHPIPQSDLTGIPLLREILERIKADKSAWNQSDWIRGNGSLNTPFYPEVQPLSPEVLDFIKENQAPPWNCGTAYCVAGHVALAKGAKLPEDLVEEIALTRVFSTASIRTPEGQFTGVSHYALKMLGLTQDQGNALFAGGNILEDIERMVEALEEDPDAALWHLSTDYEGSTNDLCPCGCGEGEY